VSVHGAHELRILSLLPESRHKQLGDALAGAAGFRLCRGKAQYRRFTAEQLTQEGFLR